MVIERLLILIGVVTIGAVAIALCRLWQARRLRNLTTTAMPAEVAQFALAGPALLYFTTPECAQCRLQQTPILAQLAQRTGIAIHKVDAVEQDAVARFYGVMTVPTTILLDRNRKPTAINHGLAPLPKLQQQVALVS